MLRKFRYILLELIAFYQWCKQKYYAGVLVESCLHRPQNYFSVECFPLKYDLNGIKSRDKMHLLLFQALL